MYLSKSNIQNWIQNESKMRVFIIFIAEIELLFFGGVAYGLNSLSPTFKHKHYFDFCKNKTGKCDKQNQTIGYLLTTTILTFGAACIPLGLLFDKYGHRFIKIVAFFTFISASLLYALSSEVTEWLLFPGTSFFSFATQSLMLCNLPLSELFPRHQNALISLLSGSFDTSAGLFALVNFTYMHGVSLLVSFLTIGGVAAIIFLIPILFYLKPYDDMKRKEIIIPVEMKEVNENQIEAANIMTSYDQYVNERYPTILKIFTSRYFIMQILFEMNLFFRFGFFLAQLNLQSYAKLSSKEAEEIVRNSGIILMFGGLMGPIAGIIVDAVKRKLKKPSDMPKYYTAILSSFSLPLLILATLNLALNILIFIPNKWAFYAALICSMIARAFLFSLDAGFIMHAFPKKRFGLVYGAVLTSSSSVSVFQFLLLFTDFNKLTIVNYVLLGFSLWNFVHPLLLLKK